MFVKSTEKLGDKFQREKNKLVFLYNMANLDVSAENLATNDIEEDLKKPFSELDDLFNKHLTNDELLSQFSTKVTALFASAKSLKNRKNIFHQLCIKFDPKISKLNISLELKNNIFDIIINTNEQDLQEKFKEIVTPLFTSAKNADECKRIYRDLSITFHPDKNKVNISYELKQRFSSIINNANEEYYDPFHIKIVKFCSKLSSDEKFRNRIKSQLENDYKIFKFLLVLETLILGSTAFVTLIFPFFVTSVLEKLNIILLNNISLGTWKKVEEDHYNDILLKIFQIATKNEELLESQTNFETFESNYKQNDPDFKELKKTYPIDHTDILFKLYFIYLYKALIENDANLSLPKRIALVPVYIALFFFNVAIELIRLAITLAIAVLFLAWAATVIITGLLTIGTPLIFKKLFCVNKDYQLNDDDEFASNDQVILTNQLVTNSVEQVEITRGLSMNCGLYEID